MAEIQYLLYLNEISYAKRQEIVTRLRDDEYGRGFIQYAKKYPLLIDMKRMQRRLEGYLLCKEKM